MAEKILEIMGLNKSFGAIKATKDLSFSITTGDIHALIGPNGAGKTTVVNQLTGDILSDSGTIIYKSRNISRLKAHQRARLGIARSFQITHILRISQLQRTWPWQSVPTMAIISVSGRTA